MTIWPRKIVVGGCGDEDDARRVLDGVCELVNDVWDRRETIEPNYEAIEELKAVEVYKLLPGTNCRECGEATCLSFAVKLSAREAAVGNCGPLLGAEHEEQRGRLVEALLARGHEVPEDLR